MSGAGPLACPRCAVEYSLDERFCPACEMPLVYAGTPEQGPMTDAHERARKVKPQYTGGELVRVAGGRNLAEAELIQGMLLEEGIPSMQRRSRGSDVPDFLAAGRRDVMVPEAALDAARELLFSTEARGGPGPAPLTDAAQSPRLLLLGLAMALLVAFAIVFALYELAT